MEKWMSRPEWASRIISSKANAELFFFLFFCIFWNAISMPILFVVPKELAKGNSLVLIALLFPIVGAWLIYFVVMMALRRGKFGHLKFEMDPYPGSLGGEVGGEIPLPRSVSPGTAVNASLSCVNVRVKRSGKNRSRWENVVWQAEREVLVELSDRGPVIRVKFEVPEGIPESGAPSEDFNQWVLRVSAELPGVDLEQAFHVPVFKTHAPLVSSLLVHESETEMTPHAESIGSPVITETMNGREFYYPVARNTGNAIFLILFGVVFGGLPVWVISQQISFFLFLAAPMLAIFVLIGAALVLYGILLLGNTLQVTVGSGKLSVVRRYFGIEFRREIESHAIAAIYCKIAGQRGQGTSGKVFYEIHVRTSDGGDFVAGDAIRGPRAARLVERMMREAANVG